MKSQYIQVSLFLTTALHYCLVVGQDDDEDVKGPIMLKNKDGTLMSTKQLIEAHQYKGETHSVPSDGYLLTAYRVTPAKLPAPPVILQHGILFSSDTWVTDNRSLAFTLSDAGYDVWLPNSRGNCYSRNHSKLNPDKDKGFWDYSFHEVGTKDMPAMIDYILKTTGQSKVHYIGHSLGTTIGLVMTSLKPDYNKKLKSLVLLSPVTVIRKAHDMMGPDGMVEAMVTKYMGQFKTADKWEFFPQKKYFNNNQTQVSCYDIEENFRDMCTSKMDEFQEVLGGAYVPCGDSLKNLKHLHQIAFEGKFNYFKYETPEENEKIYGKKEPPTYSDLFKHVTAPTILWSSENDGLVQPEDIDDLKPLLGNVIADNRIPDECFDHVAFSFPRKVACFPVREQLYKNITEALKKLD